MSNSGQDPLKDEQRKSVFDRLGRRIEINRPMSRRSPAQYGGEHFPPPPGHELEFRYGREMHPGADWRYQSERRHQQFDRERHQPPIGSMPPHYYEMDMAERQQAYYMPPRPYQNAPLGPPGPPGGSLSPNSMAMSMYMPVPSTKHDRMGPLARGGLPMRMDHAQAMAQRGFMPSGGMMVPGPYDMRPEASMLPPRWNDCMDPMMHMARPPIDERFIEPHPRFPPHQHMMPAAPDMPQEQKNFEMSRYARWRERRDVITNLDKATAQSSSRTDSLKSSLKQSDHKSMARNNQAAAQNNKPANLNVDKESTGEASGATRASAEAKAPTTEAINKEATRDKGDISDGEIIDDDSSDDSDNAKALEPEISKENERRQYNDYVHGPYNDVRVSQPPYHEQAKRRRLYEREDYSMDYETISDDELDDFMSEKRADTELDADESKAGKNSSEIELLNALGLDWANLVEMSKQAKKDSSSTSGVSALSRYSLQNYLPTIKISRDLVGPEIYELVSRACS